MQLQRKQYPQSEYLISDYGDVLSPRRSALLQSSRGQIGKQIVCDIMCKGVTEDTYTDIVRAYTLQRKIKKNGQPSVKITIVNDVGGLTQKEIYVPHAIAQLFADRVDDDYSGEGERVLSTKNGDRTHIHPENLIWTNKNRERIYTIGDCILSQDDIATIKSLYLKSNNLEQALKKSGIREYINIGGVLPDTHHHRIQTLISHGR